MQFPPTLKESDPPFFYVLNLRNLRQIFPRQRRNLLHIEKTVSDKNFNRIFTFAIVIVLSFFPPQGFLSLPKFGNWLYLQLYQNGFSDG
jgi:hypothetical protein